MPIEPEDVQQRVDRFIDQCNSNANAYPKDPRFAAIPDVHVDELHELAATAYALGWGEGSRNARSREARQQASRHDREVAEQKRAHKESVLDQTLAEVEGDGRTAAQGVEERHGGPF